jgi:hypothetical protein
VERVRWEDHKGKKILFLDYSGLRAANPSDKKQIQACINTAKDIVAEKKGKVLFLSYVHEAFLDKDVMAWLRDFAAFTNGNGYVEKECAVGVSALQKVFVTTINLFSKAKLVIFDTVDQAKDWLVS